MNIEKYWKQILNSTPDGITITDLDGTVTYISNKIKEMFRENREEKIIGTKLLDWIHPEDREKAIFYIKNASQGISTSGAAEYRMIRADKTIVTLESKGTILRDKNNKSIGMIYSSRDISARKKLETAQQISLKLKSAETLARGIAHDFNNILTIIKGHLSLIKEAESNNTDIKYSIKETEKALERAKNITRQLYNPPSDEPPVKENFQINSVLKETAELTIQEPDIKYSFLFSSDYMISADKNQINRVLTNLIINAKESMPLGGEIIFNIGIIDGFKHKFLLPMENYLFISIQDTGKGISEENLSRIFDPYFSTKERGSGLGLFTSFAILKRHNGYLDVTSTPGEGTMFTLFLPR